ncbi:hypothetical protein ABIA95_000186 [Bradyrhizobium sp. LA8.1]|uniref:hypothetical protein n=1 Tax=unclassified Bradyrhizobium TaxID=2631580 RepID=UPI00339B4BBD
MHQNEIAGLVTALAPIVGDFVGKAIAPLREQNAALLARLEALEGRSIEKGEKGDPGLPGAVGDAGRAGEPGQDGQPGRDGVDGKDGEPGRDGADGKDAPLVTAEQVAEAVMAMPEALAAAVQRYLEAKPPAAGKDGEPGRDGVDGKDGLEGKEGPAGRDGRDGLPGVHGEKGLDGRDGKDGRDGLSVEHFDVTSSDEGRTLEFSLRAEGREAVVRTVRSGSFIDRGVWKEHAFDKGDGVTWGGQFYIAQRATEANEKPLDGSSAWRLAVKKGRDGRDGKEGKSGPQGEKGDKGERGFAGMNAG